MCDPKCYLRGRGGRGGRGGEGRGRPIATNTYVVSVEGCH